MEASEIISAWLTRFDATIDAHAVAPEAVKGDHFLRRAFELAFPPEGLPDEIKIKAEGKVELLEPVSLAHRPYYLASTKETTKINPKTGEQRTSSVLTLRLKKLDGVAKALKKHGLVRVGRELASRGAAAAQSRKARGEYARTVDLMLELRKRYQAELDELETLEREYESRGDSEKAKRCREERNRICELMQRLGAGLQYWEEIRRTRLLTVRPTHVSALAARLAAVPFGGGLPT